MEGDAAGRARRRTSRGGRRPDRRLLAGAVAVAIVLVALAALGVDLIGGGPDPANRANPAAGTTAAASPSASAVGPSSSPAGPPEQAPLAGVSAGATPSPAATVPAPSTTLAPVIDGIPAPTSATGFRPEATVVAMGLPFRPGTRFAYGDGFRRPRDGVVYRYNLIRGVAADGTLLRAHDGQDLLVPVGTLVVAPFAGVVVDPAATWRPWDPGRYGQVVAIRSSEPTSPGYVVILVHLSRRSVAIGATVRRGQVVGRTGRSGNAGETVPHLHIEIRAPFLIRYGYGGVIRRLDVFDIGPSLRAAAATGG